MWRWKESDCKVECDDRGKSRCDGSEVYDGRGDTSAMAEGSEMAMKSATAVRSLAVRTVRGNENWQQCWLQVVIIIWEKKIRGAMVGIFCTGW